jgi:hypothetical protein
MSITKLLPASPIASNSDADLVLELAFLMTAADGELRAAEKTAYREVVGRLRKSPVSDADFDALLDRFAKAVGGDKSKVTARVKKVAPQVAPALRDTAFKLAMGLALVDLHGSPEEEELVGVCVEALGLSVPHAEKLAEEVRGAFGVE